MGVKLEVNFPPAKNNRWCWQSVVEDSELEDPAQLLLDISPMENELIGVQCFEPLSFRVNCYTAIDNQYTEKWTRYDFSTHKEMGVISYTPRVKESTVHVLPWEIMSMLLPFTESGNPNNGVSFEDRKPGQALAMLSLKCLGDMQIDESRK